MGKLLNYVAESEDEGVMFDHYFEADSEEAATRISRKMGWKLVKMQETPEEVCAVIELMMVKPRIH